MRLTRLPDTRTGSTAIALSHPLAVWLAYIAFVVYGSLVPLDFRPLPLDSTWLLFTQIPTLQIDVEGRADLIANAVLYIPVGFLTLVLLTRGGRASVSPQTIGAFTAAMLFCCALALVVEFAQLFFPPRTVSSNDVVAEWLGSLVGLVLAALWARRLQHLSLASMLNSTQVGQYATMAYAVAYLVLSLFPYDFLLSGQELEQKINSANWGWFLAAKSLNAGWGALLTKSVAEVLVVVPFGFLLGKRSAGRHGFSGGFVLGTILGLIVESAQWFVFSGISQGMSVLTRAVGVGLGTSVWRKNWDVAILRAWARRMAPAAGLLYLGALLATNGWFTYRWGDLDLALQKIATLRLIPFYYHYFTSEAIALVSVISVCLMYAPIAVLVWAVNAGPVAAVLAAGLVASVIEIGKLFIVGSRPDPTDVFIASSSSWALVALAQRLTAAAHAANRPHGTPAGAMHGLVHSLGNSVTKSTTLSSNRRSGAHRVSPGTVANDWRVPSVSGYVGLCIVVGLVGWTVANFPISPWLLGMALIGYGVMVWRYPMTVVVTIPAALPVLDLAPWTGRFFFDEFDLLVLLGLAVGYARVPLAPHGRRHDWVLVVVASLIGISYIVGCARGLLPWQGLDANSFTNYYSPYNGLRIGKGALWALLMYGLLDRMAATRRDVYRLFAWGMVIGLAGTVTVILWERVTFSGPFNFSSDYRVTGPFSQLHTGGAYIEGFLTAAVPFLILLLFDVRNWLARIIAIALLISTTYALMVTYSRNGYAAFAIALLLVFLAVIVEFARQGRFAGLRRGIAVLALSALALTVAVPIFKGEFFQARMSHVEEDLLLRQNHWADALRIRDSDLATAILGMGVGRYPETHYWRSTENNRSAPYRIEAENGSRFLRIGSGNAIYMEQFVAVKPRHRYLLSLDVRAHKPKSIITVPICEKWLLTSYECAWQSFDLGPDIGEWRHYEKLIAAESMADGHWYARRPVRLTLYNSSGSAAVDVNNVHLVSSEGVDLLINGDFKYGLDHWFFSTDSHLPWHIKNLWVSVLFDQGWFGVLALGLFVVVAIGRAAREAWNGNLGSGAVLAAISGFLVVGLLDSLLDTPRFLFLFMLLLWMGCLEKSPSVHRAVT